MVEVVVWRLVMKGSAYDSEADASTEGAAASEYTAVAVPYYPVHPCPADGNSRAAGPLDAHGARAVEQVPAPFHRRCLLLSNVADGVLCRGV